MLKSLFFNAFGHLKERFTGGVSVRLVLHLFIELQKKRRFVHRSTPFMSQLFRSRLCCVANGRYVVCQSLVVLAQSTMLHLAKRAFKREIALRELFVKIALSCEIYRARESVKPH